MIKVNGQTLQEKIAADKEAQYQAYVAQVEAQEKAMAEAMANGTHPNAKLQGEIDAIISATFASKIADEAIDAANWRDIPGFEKYEIRLDGTVRRKQYRVIYRDPARFYRRRKRYFDRRELAIHTVNGHRAVSVKVGGKVKKIYVDSMVRKLFHEADPAKTDPYTPHCN